MNGEHGTCLSIVGFTNSNNPFRSCVIMLDSYVVSKVNKKFPASDIRCVVSCIGRQVCTYSY